MVTLNSENNTEMLKQTKDLDMKITEIRNKILQLSGEIKNNYDLYKNSGDKEKEEYKSKLSSLLKRKKNYKEQLNNFIEVQFQIDIHYIQTEYEKDKSRADTLVKVIKSSDISPLPSDGEKEQINEKIQEYQEIVDNVKEFISKYKIDEYEEELLELEYENIGREKEIPYDFKDVCKPFK